MADIRQGMPLLGHPIFNGPYRSAEPSGYPAFVV